MTAAGDSLLLNFVGIVNWINPERHYQRKKTFLRNL